MRQQYLVRIDKDVDSDWGASVPDLPGCVATGKTIDAALRRIEGAIELHVRGLREDGIRVPPPRHRVVRPRRTMKQVNFYATVEVAAYPGARSGRRWSGAD
jgi:predicted RNase H-like HicB family nuclease